MARLAPALLACALAAGCDAPGEPPAPPGPRDPQVARALADPLMTDPDLSTRNEGAAALTVEPGDTLPAVTAAEEEVARARAEAATLVGGADRLLPVGEPAATSAALHRDASPRAHVAALLGEGDPCADDLRRSTAWAARLPPALPVYPRANTLAAAGSDRPGCRVRSVTFATGAAPAEVIAFYAARARAIGARGPAVMRAGGDLRLRGAAGGLAYDIYAGRDGERTVVRLTTVER